MRVTKFTHACVRIETAGTAITIDPGSFSEQDSVDGVGAVLVPISIRTTSRSTT